MKKTFKIILLAFLLCGLALVLPGCKSRKLSKEKTSTVDKTVTQEASKVINIITTNKADTSKTVKETVDKSGTWIWEEWSYKADIDTIAKGNPVLLSYKKTTNIQNDKKETVSIDNAILENHSEIKDNAAVKSEKKDLTINTESKDLEAVKKGNGWVWAIMGMILLLTVMVWIIKTKQ